MAWKISSPEYTYLIPQVGNDGHLFGDSVIADWRNAILDIAGGFTIVPGLIGFWRDSGILYEDKLTEYRVSGIDHGQATWLAQVALTLYRQHAIYVKLPDGHCGIWSADAYDPEIGSYLIAVPTPGPISADALQAAHATISDACGVYEAFLNTGSVAYRINGVGSQVAYTLAERVAGLFGADHVEVTVPSGDTYFVAVADPIDVDRIGTYVFTIPLDTRPQAVIDAVKDHIRTLGNLTVRANALGAIWCDIESIEYVVDGISRLTADAIAQHICAAFSLDSIDVAPPDGDTYSVAANTVAVN